MDRLEAPSTLAEQPGHNYSHGYHDGGGPELAGTEQVAKHAEQHARHSQHPCLAWGRHAPNDHQQPQHGGRQADRPVRTVPRARWALPFRLSPVGWMLADHQDLNS
jgi:hypothetical protein